MTTIANVLPDLSAITSVTGLRDAATDSVIARLSTGAIVDPIGSSPASTQPATIVDLSDHAKAVLARAKTEQVAADRLEAQVRASSSDALGSNRSTTGNSPEKSTFDQIHDLGRELTTSAGAPNASDSAGKDFLGGTPIWRQTAAADNIAILQAGAQLYNRPQEMEDIAKNGGQFASPTEGHVVSDDVLFVFTVHSQIALKISDLREKGMTDQARALGDALQNGTLKFQKASEVPDLNMQSWMIHFADAGGGGEMGSSSVKPTGASKAATDSGKALALSMGDRGDFYITW
jgi:hypothetical protein